MNQAAIENWFSHHPPRPEQLHAYEAIRSKAKELAELFNTAVPDCGDKTAAIRRLRETVMAMNSAIACYEPGVAASPQNV